MATALATSRQLTTPTKDPPMKTIDSNTLVTATGGYFVGPYVPAYGPGPCGPPVCGGPVPFAPAYAPVYRPIAAARWAYSGGYSYGYATRWGGPRWAY
jgi:hypothetical protein